jgi:serine/threonine protein kinase
MTNEWAAVAAAVFAAVLLGTALYLIVGRRKPAKKPRRKGARPRVIIRTSTRIDQYRFIENIHVGQFSEVLEARDEIEDKAVAIKCLLEPHLADPRIRKALRHEWEVGRKFDHPQLIRFKEFIEDKTVACIVMDYFASRNLKKRILVKQRAFIEERAERIMVQVCRALAYMHDRGLVHRDVKPANILIADDGEVKLIDFGLTQRSASSRWRRLWRRQKMVQGTISYMSPEQVRGERVDFRSDIYSLGVTFFEMVAGRAPLVGQTPNEVFNKHLTAIPELVTVYNPYVSDEFAILLKWMLEKDPGRRPRKVEMVLSRIEETPLFRAETSQGGKNQEPDSKNQFQKSV